MMIYLDNAATTFQKPESVYSAMDNANRNFSVNAGRGAYALAREAEKEIEVTKNLLKKVTEAGEMAEVVFTTSATLAFNAVIGGLKWSCEDVVYVTPYEHNAVMRTLYAWQQQYGFQIEELPLTDDTLEIDFGKMAYCFAKKPPSYVFVNMVSNVTGYVLPVERICEAAQKYDCTIILDGAQALGCVPFSLQNCGADFFIFAGHKALCGPFGVGGYINIKKKPLKKIFFGGTGSDSLNPVMPEGNAGYEPGSPNIPAIMGLQAALREIQDRELQQQFWQDEQNMIRNFKKELSAISGLVHYWAPDEAQAGIVSVNLESYTAQELGRILDEDYNIAVRTGYHCAPLIHKYLQDIQHVGTVRISIGRFTTEEDCKKLVEVLQQLADEW